MVKCKDCKWAYWVRTYIYNCLYEGMVSAEGECNKFEDKESLLSDYDRIRVPWDFHFPVVHGYDD